VGKQIRLVGMLAIIVLILICAIWVLDSTEKEHEVSEVVFRNSPPTDVRIVNIKNEYGEMVIDYMDGGYVVGNIPIDVVDMSKFVDMMTDAGAVNAITSIKNHETLSHYGLEKPNAKVKILFADDETLNIKIGNYEPISKAYYCMLDGYDDVYLFEENRVDGFMQEQEYYISTYVTPKIPQQSQSSLGHVLDIEFNGDMLKKPVKLDAVSTDDAQSMLDVLSFGSATHLIELNGMKRRVDQRYATMLFDSVLGLTAIDIVDYNLTETEMSEFGFDNPDMHISFDYRQALDVPNQRYDLKILLKNNVFYADCNDRGIIYQINPPFFYGVELEKIPVRWFFSPILFDLKELEIETEGDKYLFVLSGTTNADLAVTCNGESFDLDRFRKLYRLVTSAAHDNRMSDVADLNQEAKMNIIYRYRHDKKELDELRLFEAGGRRQYAMVNGLTEFTIKEQFYTRVSQALDVLFTQEEFEIEW